MELHGAQRDHEAEVFHVSNNNSAVAQRWLKDKQPEEKTNTNCLVKEHENEYQTGWQIKTVNVFDSCNQRSTHQCIKSRVAKHLGVAGIHQQNGLVDETNVTLFAKVVLYRNMGFNESGEYKKTFIGSGVGAGLQEVQTQNLMDYQLACDRDQHLACELFGYREDGNEAAFLVAVWEKIYAHESLTFNNTVACDVIYKWKTRLKVNMYARSDVYVLNNNDMVLSCGCKAEIWATKGLLVKAKGNVLGMETSRTRVGSLSGDYDVKKNDKWSCVYAVGSQEYQMVCTILDIESADVGKWLKGLLTESRYELRLVGGIATGALAKGGSRSKVPA
uniref:Zinc finger, CCHC-type n=1 Tax=Tanacetum cinerariifolium TaxID=118510 RepID=A0A6L2NWR6_TANCI|nr:zinc finger, CCHC-type [Tanacetum cinerariifolium]